MSSSLPVQAPREPCPTYFTKEVLDQKLLSATYPTLDKITGQGVVFSKIIQPVNKENGKRYEFKVICLLPWNQTTADIIGDQTMLKLYPSVAVKFAQYHYVDVVWPRE